MMTNNLKPGSKDLGSLIIGATSSVALFLFALWWGEGDSLRTIPGTIVMFASIPVFVHCVYHIAVIAASMMRGTWYKRKLFERAGRGGPDKMMAARVFRDDLLSKGATERKIYLKFVDTDDEGGWDIRFREGSE